MSATFMNDRPLTLAGVATLTLSTTVGYGHQTLIVCVFACFGAWWRSVEADNMYVWGRIESFLGAVGVFGVSLG